MSVRLALPDRGAYPRARVGAKAWGLRELRRLGMPVPDWGVLLIDDADADAVVRIEAALGTLLRRLGGDRFAVRSSSTLEDGHTFSLAGQFRSELNVPREAVAAAVRRVLASAAAPVAGRYRDLLPGGPARMGVIVQEQLAPRYAGVLFTLDPTLRDTGALRCEWGPGLAEARVAGREAPEHLRIDRATLRADGAVPAPLAAALPRLARMALTVERRLGTPVDIEWCVDETGPKLVQARPVTAIRRRGVTAWSSSNLNENFPEPLAPLAWSMITRFYRAYVGGYLALAGLNAREARALEQSLGGWLGTFEGRVHYNLRAWYALIDCFPLAARLRRGLDHFLGIAVPLDLGRAPEARRLARRWRRPGALLDLGARLTWRHLFAERLVRRFQRRFLAERRRWRTRPYAEQGPGALAGHVEALLAFARREYQAQCVADLEVLVFPALYAAAARRAGLTREAILAALGGVGAESARQATLVREMADYVNGCDAAAGALERGCFEEALRYLGPAGRTCYARFMEEFGGRCYHDCQLVSPTFEERPQLYWSLVGHARAHRPEVAARAPGQDGADRAAGGPLLRFLRRRARRAIGLRERGRIVRSLLFGELRQLFLALGRQLAEGGRLATPEQVFLLRWPELRELAAGRPHLAVSLAPVLEARSGALAEARGRRLPELVFAEEGHGPLSTLDATPGAGSIVRPDGGSGLAGVAVATGRARGRVRVVRCPLTDAFEPGDILVAYAVDPGWTTLLTLCGGIVLEKGGVLSHAAIVAREFGIPAVTGVSDAMARLGEIPEVTVDGFRGLVEPVAP